MPESELFREIKGLRTERINPDTREIDLAETKEILEMINREDKKVALAVEREIPRIEKAVDIITENFRRGGRLIYVGAGTSGRLGIVDASECPPTFGSPPEMVQGIIAGGREAVFLSQEGAEDSREAGALAMQEIPIRQNDTVCGIAASGRTPFVRGAVEYARQNGISTLFISTSGREQAEKMGIMADVIISPEVGPEAIAGSTRMKSGTAQKLVLNMLTTASMIKLGKTYGNVMVDLQQTNKKLVERSRRIIMEITGADYDTAAEALKKSGSHVKTALVMLLTGTEPEEARELLKKNDGFVRKAIMK
jgi:N-acetylmuramic acid 6-phosphate etherase